MSKDQKAKIYPTDKQMRFLTCPADEVFYGGARGGGKSFGLCMAAIGGNDQNLFTNKNWSALILRRTYGESETTIIRKMRAMIGDKAKYDAVKHRFTSAIGGIIQFGHIKNLDDVYRHQGTEYNRILVDELTHFTEEMFNFLITCNRTTDPKLKCQMFATSNPGGIGHNWVKKRFIDCCVPEEIFELHNVFPNGKEYVRTRAFIPAKVYDNEHIMDNDPEYVNRLMDQPEVWRRAFLDGDWNIFAGQFFKEFSECHICEDFEIPDHWPIWISMDYGYATRCSIGFYTKDTTSGTYYRFGELYVKETGPDDLSVLIKAFLGKRIVNVTGCFADRRIFVKDEDSYSTQEKFSLNGFHFALANDNRVEGWYRTRELLMKDKDGMPNFKVFASCIKFIELIPQMIHDERKPEDIDKRCEGHIADEFRYFSTMRKGSSYETEVVEPMEFNPVTGYLGRNSDDTLLRNKIKRLKRYSGKEIQNFILDRRNENVA